MVKNCSSCSKPCLAMSSTTLSPSTEVTSASTTTSSTWPSSFIAKDQEGSSQTRQDDLDNPHVREAPIGRLTGGLWSDEESVEDTFALLCGPHHQAPIDRQEMPAPAHESSRTRTCPACKNTPTPVPVQDRHRQRYNGGGSYGEWSERRWSSPVQPQLCHRTKPSRGFQGCHPTRHNTDNGRRDSETGFRLGQW